MALADLLKMASSRLEPNPWTINNLNPGNNQAQIPTGPNIQDLVGTEDINVLANKAPVFSRNETQDAPINLGNRSMLEEAQASIQNNPQHKGMFGVKGTLRDVLGLVGDSLLMGGGGKAMYQPARQREKESDALQGFTQNPQAAIERTIAAGGDPTPLIKAYQLQQVQQQEVKAAIAKQEVAAVERRIKGGQVLSQFLGGINSGEAWNKLRPVAEKMAKAYGLDPEDVPVDYDPDTFRALRLSGASVSQQLSDEDRDADRTQRAQLAREAEAGRNKRDNPPAPPRGSPEGITAVDASVARKVLAGTATPNEQAYYETRIKRAEPTGRKGRTKPAGTASGWGTMKVK